MKRASMASAMALAAALIGGQTRVWPAASAALPAASAASPDWPETLTAVVGHVVVVALPEPVSRVAVGDPKVADYRLMSRSELYVLGKSVGTTNFLLWRHNAAPISLIVRVGADLSPLAESLKLALPQELDIDLMMASGSVVLRGSVADVGTADAALQLAQAYARQLNRYLSSGGGATSSASGQSQVINLLRVRDAQQVMLDVRIAEVSKSLLDKLGLQVQAAGGGDIRWNVLSSFLGAGGSAAAGLLFSNGNAVNLQAEKQDGLVRILAEPTIVAMSGQEGSFLVGGKVYIPITQSVGIGGTAVTLQEREFGVGLKFVPTVLDGGRISLKVAPEVSEISKESIVAGSQTGTTLLPAFTTRRVSTTVQLKDGQSLVIGGLIRNNSSANRNAFPVLGELPILGALFRSSQFVADLTELVVVVRASLVQATEAAPSLPTDSVVAPTRQEFFLGNRLQSAPPAAPTELQKTLTGDPDASP